MDPLPSLLNASTESCRIPWLGCPLSAHIVAFPAAPPPAGALPLAAPPGWAGPEVPQADRPKAPRAEPAARPRNVRRLVREVVIDPPGKTVGSCHRASTSFEIV